MSLRKMIRNIRRRVSVDWSRNPQGISFDLTTEEGRLAAAKWAHENPLKPPPWETSDGS